MASRLRNCLACMLVLAGLPILQGRALALKTAEGEITATEAGVKVAVPGLPEFTIEYPLKAMKLLSCKPEETGADLEYEGGARLKVTIEPDGSIVYAFTNFPASLKSVDLWMDFDSAFGEGGTYRLNDEALQPFPPSPEKIFFVQKHNCRRWALHDSKEHNLVFSLPGHTYLQMEDRRKELPSRYRMIMASPVLPGNPKVTVKVGDLPFSTPPAGQKPLRVKRVKNPPAVDGNPEDWKELSVQEIPSGRKVEGKTAEGLSGKFQICHDGQRLYLLARVSDPAPGRNSNPPASAWSGDAVEFFFGGTPTGQGGDLLRTDSQIVFGASPEKPPIYSRDLKLDDVQSVVNVVEGGWILEASIPLKSLGWDVSGEREYRFDVGIDDSVDGKNRRCQIMWNGTNRNALSRTNWGTAVFEGSGTGQGG